MGKISYEDKMHVQTLRKMRFGYKTIVAKISYKSVLNDLKLMS